MIELSGFGTLLTAINWLYWLVAVALVATTWRWSRGRKTRVLSSGIVTSIFLVWPGMRVYYAIQHQKQYAQAKEIFDERCKRSGERIFKTAKNIEGIFLLRPRPAELNLSNQYQLDDPYGRDSGGDGYITSFLMGRNSDGTYTEQHTRGAFKFVETKDGDSAQIRRWTAVVTPRAVREFADIKLRTEVSPSRSSNYGVTWVDLSTKEDRDHWIAGSSLQVIELETNTVIAERIGYMFDAGLGDQNGGRSPWAYAENNACPTFGRSSAGAAVKSSRSRDFVYRVLTPP